MSRPRVVVAGLGDTGVLTAIQLRRHADIVGITAKPEMVSGQELGLRLARPDAWMHDYRIAYDRFRGLDRARVVQGSLTSLDVDAQTVHVEHADGSSSDEPYDVLVIATGVTNGFWRHPALQHSDGVDTDLATAHHRIADAASVAIVGGGAAAMSCAAQVSEQWPTKKVDLYFPGERGLPHHHGRVWKQVEARLVALGVGIHPGHRAVLPADADQLSSDPIAWSTGQPPSTADVVVWAIGKVRPNTAWLPPDMLDDHGFVQVTPTLRVPSHDNIFAVGDVAATDPLRTSARNRGHKLVAHNVRALRSGKPLRDYRSPTRRWGSVLGPQRDGLVVFAPNGLGFRVSARLVDVLLQRFVNRRIFYGGVRKRSPSMTSSTIRRAS
ncbi:NAD(P)/FAD-dependent oxidoreductase [Antrihabitans cavernicola]|uniref:Pyridine nucleotide-disulfide oxidoreductase n=1 Tax=Antrihabitans cavernicola TaxID=2495913 RepID=A0A5A7S301_9NOCA|nr:FAD-dependent oxidoreductase [Spelaeibacter cavernicola]KAA0018523.1 pyridine nucleotide-disulfide oxidoreductase [Spelaeibacter cavernicola]